MPENCPFDIDDPSIIDDPYTKYAELRATCPVGFSETAAASGTWPTTSPFEPGSGTPNCCRTPRSRCRRPEIPWGSTFQSNSTDQSSAMAGTPRPTLFADSHGELSPCHS